MDEGKISQNGFTLIELIVVIAIFGMLATVLALNLAGQRLPRDLKIAQSEMVTNLRAIESYTLASRTLANGQSPDYYLIKFDLSKPTQYTIQAMYNVSSAPMLVDVQTVSLPANIVIGRVVIDSSLGNDPNNPGPYTETIAKGGCGLMAVGAPFEKIYFESGCSPAALPSSPYAIQTGDSYNNILTFVSNNDCAVSQQPAVCVSSVMNITLVSTNRAYSKTVSINGVIGSVTFN